MPIVEIHFSFSSFSDKFMYEVSHTIFDFVARLLLVDLTTGYRFQSSVESIT